MLKTKRPSKSAAKIPARDPARTRAALLDAAFDEMHRSGFRGADVESILDNVGVTKGALYHHFDSKEALGYAVVDEVIADLTREKWQRPLEQSHNPVDVLIGIIRSTSMASHETFLGCPLNNIAQEMSPLDEGFRKRTARIFTAWQKAIAAALRAGKSHGTVSKEIDPDDAATFLIAAFEGYMSLAKNAQDAGFLRSGQKALVSYLDSLRPRRGRQAAS